MSFTFLVPDYDLRGVQRGVGLVGGCSLVDQKPESNMDNACKQYFLRFVLNCERLGEINVQCQVTAVEVAAIVYFSEAR